jgi:hypothetical protein
MIFHMTNDTAFRWVVIDGPELVCIDGTGDLPLFMYSVDASKCAPVVSVPHITPQLFAAVPAIPEPSTWALMVGSLVVGRLWSQRKRSALMSQKRGPHDYK